jgi:hypothetical protein
MQITVIGIKDFRQNISPLAKATKDDNNTTYIVTVHNQPVWEVKPCYNAPQSLDDTQVQYYKHIQKNLSFWNDDADDDIFVA